MVSRQFSSKIRIRWLLPGVLGLALISGLLLLISPVGAHHFDNMYKTANYSPNCVDGGNSTPGASTFCQTDNSTLTVFRESSLSVSGKSNIAFVLNNSFDPTDLNVTIESSGTYSGSSETDIIYQKRTDIPGTSRAIAWCDDAVTTTKCDQHYVAFDEASPPTYRICHETGHAVGLTHGEHASPVRDNDDPGLDCLEAPSVGSSGVIGFHSSTLINDTY